MGIRKSAFYLFLTIIIISSCRNKNENRQSNRKTDNVRRETVSEEDLVKKYVNKSESAFHDELDAFYRSRSYSPAWFDNGRITKNATILENELKNSFQQGLDPSVYNVSLIDSLKQKSDTLNMPAGEAARIDVLLSGAFMEYASDLLSGRIKPDSLDIEWESYREKKSLKVYLEEALKNNSVSKTLFNLRPHNELYYRLLDAFATLSEADWPLPGYFPALKLNDRNRNVIKIKKFLAATKDLTSNDSTYIASPVFDGKLEPQSENFRNETD